MLIGIMEVSTDLLISGNLSEHEMESVGKHDTNFHILDIAYQQNKQFVSE